jgi:uncharacterized protein DUF4333
MMIDRLRRTLPATLVLGALALGACTTTAVLDDSRLQTEIQTGFEEQTGIAVQSLDCPDSQPLQANATFECTLTTDTGDTVGIRVTQTDAQGNVRWEVIQ